MPDDSDRLKTVSLTFGEVISSKSAAILANTSIDTVVRWAKRYGIGRQLSPGAPWKISKPALLAVAAADVDALEALQRREFDHPAVAPYLDKEGEAA